MSTFTYTTPTLITKALHLYSSTATFNDFYSELMSYTALASYYEVSAHDSYQFQGPPHPLTIMTTVAI